MQSVPTQYYYYMPVPMEGDQQQQGYPMGAFAVETPEPEVVQPKEETKKDIEHKCDTEDQKKKKKPKFKKLSGGQKFLIVIGALSVVGFFMKLLGVGVGLAMLSHMYHSCENPPHHVDRQWATNPAIASNIKIDITSAMVHVRTCPHAKSITIHTSSRSKNPEDLTRMVPSYFVMDGTISVTAKFPAFDFDSCASVKVDIVVPESLASPANLFVTSETGVVYVMPKKHHKEHHEEHHFRLKNETRPLVFNNIDISTKAGHVEVANVNTRGSVNIFSKVGGVTLKDVTASFITGSTVTGFVNVEHVRIGQLTTIADSGSVTLRDIVFEEKINLDQYFLLASIDLGSLQVKGIRNKLNDEHTALVTISSGSGHADVKLSKKSNLKFAVSTESGAIELRGKNLPTLVENTETAKTGRIEGQGSLTDVTIATSSGRAHVNFRECKKHHGKHHEEKDHKGDSDKDEPTQDEHHDEDPATTTTEHDKPKIHPHHTKPHKTNEPKTGGMHVERPHRTRA